MLKQRQQEEKMMENRIAKLGAEENRLNKQIAAANRHADFADQVNERRLNDFNRKQAHYAMQE